MFRDSNITLTHMYVYDFFYLHSHLVILLLCSQLAVATDDRTP